MNKESILSILRFILTAVGAYMAGKFFLGSPIDNNLWLGLTSAIIAVGSSVWGIVDKTATLEGVQSALTSSITFFGTLLVGAGVIKDGLLQAILGLISIIVPLIYSEIQKKKNIAVATGKLGVADLSGVSTTTLKLKPTVVTPEKVAAK